MYNEGLRKLDLQEIIAAARRNWMADTIFFAYTQNASATTQTLDFEQDMG